MLWGNWLSFHNSLSISGAIKVENYWEIFNTSNNGLIPVLDI